MTNNITVSGVGCCLVDYLYNNVSFTSATFRKYISKKSGDGGLTPGQLVLTGEFEKHLGCSFESAIADITNSKAADKINIGGPGIVALIHAAQILENSNCRVRFYGARGRDESGEYLQKSLGDTPVDISNYRIVEGPTPSTIVLSDPDFNNGTGERVFINSLGAAGNYLPEYLDREFFASDIVVFGGTALVPSIHDHLTGLLLKSKAEGCITVVNTVYDFINQKSNPDKKWPMGRSDESYSAIDVLLTNHEEALRLSGKSSLKEAVEFFKLMGTGAVVVTNGAQDVILTAQKKGLFHEIPFKGMPVSRSVTEDLTRGHNGDTTGCGDNFAGGIISSLVMQLQRNEKKMDLQEACTWGIVSGGFSCFYMGGTYHQKEPGEKKRMIEPYYRAYLKQMSND